MENSIWKFEGRTFHQSDLRFLSGTFLESYSHIIETHAVLEFFVGVNAATETRHTFAQFDQDVRRVASLLQAEPVEVVATAAGNTYEHAVFIFASILSGKTLAPMNASETAAYIESHLARIGRPTLLFTDRPEIPGRRLEIPKIEKGSETLMGAAREFIYILTSGSTGSSKFVRQTETGVLANVDALIRHHGLDRRKTIGTSLPIFHVNALEFSLFASFFSGGRLVLWRAFDPVALLSSRAFKEAEIYSSIPMLIKLIGDVFPAGALSHLSYFVSAATYLSQRIVGEIHAKHAKRIVQGYGLSEAVNFSCLLPVNLPQETYSRVMLETEMPSIGPAVWGNEVTIVGEHGREAAEGETGDIFVRGFNVMAGYLESESPFHPEFGLHTGDRGYYKSIDGHRFIFIKGRSKDIVKRNGETIGLRDIDEAVLAAGIAGLDGIAVPFRNEWRGEEVGLVVRISEDADPEWRERLTVHLRTLSESRRPKIIFKSEEVLRTASGKPLRWRFVPLFVPFQKTTAFKSDRVLEA